MIDLLLLDETNPRSVAFQIAAIVDHVEQLPRDTDENVRTPEQRLVLSLAHRGAPRRNSRALRGGQRGAARRPGGAAPDDRHRRAHLSELITRRYFSHAEPRRPADLR